MSDLQDSVKTDDLPSAFGKASLFRGVIFSGLILFALVSIVALVIRGISIARYGQYLATSGTEGSNTYAIWKLLHGYPLYEWPDRYPYGFTPYNFLFYNLYAAIAALFGGTNPDSFILTGRMTTLVFALLGASLQCLLVRQICGIRSTTGHILNISLSIATWLGLGFVGWWSLTLRPDVVAQAIVVAALLGYCQYLSSKKIYILLLSSVLFFLAWSFKQVTVWSFVGICVHSLFFEKKLKQTILLALPFSALVVAALWIGGSVLRYNIIEAQAINAISLRQSIYLGLLALVPNLYVFVPGLLLVVPRLVFGENNQVPQKDLFSRETKAVLCVFVISLVMGFIALGRDGSSRNQIMECFISASILSGVTILQLQKISNPSRIQILTSGVVACLVFSSLLFSVVQLVIPNRFGKLTLTKAEFERQAAIAEYVKTLPKPFWTDDDILSMPWHANGNQYPAFPLVSCYYDVAQTKNILKDDGLEGLISRHEIRSIYVDRSSRFARIAQESGFKLMGNAPALSNDDRVILALPAE